MTVYFKSSENILAETMSAISKRKHLKKASSNFPLALMKLVSILTVRASNLELAQVSFFCVSHFFVFCKSGNVFKSSKL